ncbi:DUF2752 domain-containing protein [Algoriphagus boritolerans]|uniref:DUF2752 domain-containing protein n=1 Tax=Algoriphagus boritolerans TaxID=308111 RepID=UPI002FCDF129
MEPHAESHLSLCPLNQLGFEWCPGCGLGRSMNLLAHGDFQASWSMHAGNGSFCRDLSPNLESYKKT